MINNSLIGENNILIVGPKLRISLHCTILSILMLLMGKLFQSNIYAGPDCPRGDITNLTFSAHLPHGTQALAKQSHKFPR